MKRPTCMLRPRNFSNRLANRWYYRVILELYRIWFDPLLLTMFPSQSWVSTPLKLAAMASVKFVDVNSCIYHIQDLRRIRRHLDLESAKLLASALVSSRLDCCNSLLCMGLQKLTSPNSNIYWTVWLVWSQSHHHLLAVFHCCAPFIAYQ